jgi:hypothetical protein
MINIDESETLAKVGLPKTFEYSTTATMSDKNQRKSLPFETQIVGKNLHSIWTFCANCGARGVNIPLNTQCGNCGSFDTLTYYDAQTIQAFLDKTRENGE